MDRVPRSTLLLAAICCATLEWSALRAAPVTLTFDIGAVEERPEHVAIAGSFNEWKPDSMVLSGEEFSVTLELAEGEHVYKFLGHFTDGHDSWLLDPSWPVYVPDTDGKINHLMEIRQGQIVRPEGLELFEYYETFREDPSHVTLAGDFNNWNQGEVRMRRDAEAEIWRAWLRQPRPITYKFIVDGIWKTEPKDALRHVQHVSDHFGSMNSIRMPMEPIDDPNDWFAEDEQHYLEGLDIPPGHAGKLALAKEHSRRGNYGTAIALARRAARQANPNKRESIDALMNEAEIHRRFGYSARGPGGLSDRRKPNHSPMCQSMTELEAQNP